GSGGRRHSQAEFESFNERSIAPQFGFDSSQFSRVQESPSAGRHSRVNSVVSPGARARAIEDTRNALSAGTRHVAAAASDSFAWGSPSDAMGRARTGSVASAARMSFQDPRLSFQDPRANALALPHRASYAGSVAPSVVGSAYRDRAVATANNTASASGASATRRPRRSSGQPQNPAAKGKSAIRSNWYHREEMVNAGDAEGQDFASSDEEDFDADGDYDGNMVAQQRLIEKQHRQIFDLGMRNKILEKAMADKCGKPYEALADDLGRTCASNRKANRVIKQLSDELEALKAHCQSLQGQVCQLPHGMTDAERAHMDELNYKLGIETAVSDQFRRKLDERDALCRDTQERLDRETMQSEYWQNMASKLSAELNATAAAASAADPPLSLRARAGTATTMSES
ncbi:hypothetical protein IWW38_005761, partial [Coemansia aciculifera]